MEKITTLDQLNEAISVLEAKQRDIALDLAAGIKQSVEDFNPVNLIKNKLTTLLGNSDIKSTLFSALIKISGTWLSNKFQSAKTPQPVNETKRPFVQITVPKIVIHSERQIVYPISNPVLPD